MNEFEQMLKDFCEDRNDIVDILTLDVANCRSVGVVLQCGDVSVLTHEPPCRYPTWRHIEGDKALREFRAGVK